MNTSDQRKRYLTLYRQHVQQELDALGYARQEHSLAAPGRGAAPASFRVAGVAAFALVLAGLALVQLI